LRKVLIDTWWIIKKKNPEQKTSILLYHKGFSKYILYIYILGADLLKTTLFKTFKILNIYVLLCLTNCFINMPSIETYGSDKSIGCIKLR
jgi:hypothetical protein